jgi:hypothetical protein
VSRSEREPLAPHTKNGKIKGCYMNNIEFEIDLPTIKLSFVVDIASSVEWTNGSPSYKKYKALDPDWVFIDADCYFSSGDEKYRLLGPETMPNFLIEWQYMYECITKDIELCACVKEAISKGELLYWADSHIYRDVDDPDFIISDADQDIYEKFRDCLWLGSNTGFLAIYSYDGENIIEAHGYLHGCCDAGFSSFATFHSFGTFDKSFLSSKILQLIVESREEIRKFL